MFGAGSKPITVNKETIIELLTRGVEEVISYEKLEEELLSGKKLRIKLGIDPTSPNIHLGRAVLLLKLQDFQKLGHKVILIIGDSTGVIGDTSDKDTERPMLTKSQVKENQKTYFEQVGKILDLKLVEKHYNSEWLADLTYHEIGEQADQFSVADFIARENIKKRLKEGKRVSLRETLYPLMQGYDSVAIESDVEIGGTDQRFNLLAGRKLQEHYKQKPQNILMTKLIQGLDGRKMSSSWGNTINIIDEPFDMYGKVMSMSDELVDDYFVLCTRVSTHEIERMKKEREAKTLHPRDMKMKLAREIVTIYHGGGAAERAEKNFVDTFSKGGMPNDIKEITVEVNTPLVDILLNEKIISSKNEFRTLVNEGAVSSATTKEKITDPNFAVTRGYDIKIGKKRFLKIRLRK